MRCAAASSLEALTVELLSGRWTIASEVTEGSHRCYTATRVAPTGEPTRALSASEREVLTRALRGDSNKQIAYELGVVASGVSTLLSRARKKLRGRVPEDVLASLLGAVEAERVRATPILAAAS